jgi:endonuclease G
MLGCRMGRTLVEGWRRKIRFLVLACCLPLASAFAGSDEAPPKLDPITVPPLCLAGCPLGAPAANRLVTGETLIFSNNGRTKFADWTAYIVTARHFGPSRVRNWHADPRLPENETLEPEDYEGAYAALGVDRGHLAPLASFSGAGDWRSLNYLSNVTPQMSALNRGPWAGLEKAVRQLAVSSEASDVYVLTGPLYERTMPVLPKTDEPHSVPSGYWKVVAIVGADGVEAAAFVMDQGLPREADFCRPDLRTALGDMEHRIGLRLFPELSAAAREDLAARSGTMVQRLGCGRRPVLQSRFDGVPDHAFDVDVVEPAEFLDTGRRGHIDLR